MSRSPTEQEWNELSKAFPNLRRSDVTIIGERTKAYNCIGWSLGLDQWINPLSPLSDFNTTYRLYSPVEHSSDDVVIDGWGRQNGILMEHASKYSNGTWSSKLGGSLCITHNRDGLISPQKYGTILISYASTQALTNLKRGDVDDLLSTHEQEMLNQASATLPENIKQNFESTFQEWRNTWFVGDMGHSSNTYYRASGEAFNKLVAMGQQIIPLVAQKLAESDNFVAIVLYERLEKRPNLQAQIDQERLESEQARSKRTVKLWLQQSF